MRIFDFLYLMCWNRNCKVYILFLNIKSGLTSERREGRTKRALAIFAIIITPSITPRIAWKRISDMQSIITPVVTVSAVNAYLFTKP